MKKMVFTFGRFTPPQVGHAKVINKVVDLAKSIGGDNRIYTSASFDSSKNPIPFNEKVYFLKQLFPNANINSDKSLTNLIQILKGLVEEGYTDIKMIIGEDREDEFRNLFKKYVRNAKDKDYDPKKHFKFNSFEVVSAGQRNEKATGLEGASGTKMREYVAKNDFNSFAKYTPTKNIALIRKIFTTVKRNMNIKEDAPLEVSNGRALFKAVFVIGGPGSGKDRIIRTVLSGYGLVEISTNTAFEYFMKKSEPEYNTRTKIKETLALRDRLGIIINGSGEDYNSIDYVKKNLESLGYDTRMVIVETSDTVSHQRNLMHDRVIPEIIRREKWILFNQNIKHYARLFGNNIFYVNNSFQAETDNDFIELSQDFKTWAGSRPANTNTQYSEWLAKGHLNELYNLGLNKIDINEIFAKRMKGDKNGRR